MCNAMPTPVPAHGQVSSSTGTQMETLLTQMHQVGYPGEPQGPSQVHGKPGFLDKLKGKLREL